jgi:hypothetical protein
MPAAIRPYSIAVAADSSFRNALSFRTIAGIMSDSSKRSVKVRARN